MESWSRVIVEWVRDNIFLLRIIQSGVLKSKKDCVSETLLALPDCQKFNTFINCLDVSETPINNINQLQSQKCYEKLTKLLSWKNKDVSSKDDIVTRFLIDEYPEFKIENKQDMDSNNIDIGSLLLLYASQDPAFHKPMCGKLQHDTQIKVKSFLEMVLPYGKYVTKEKLSKALAELTDVAPKTPTTTPRMQSLKEFFNTPGSRSALCYRKSFEYNRELRHLRSELDVERFEKADLQEDLVVHQNEIQILQKKLQEKNVELKLLKEERIRPATPQSGKKHKNMKHYGDLHRKEIDQLEQKLLQQRCKLSKVEGEKESVSKRLASRDRECTALKNKCADFESSTESLLTEIEYRDKELVDLRMANEELRAYLEEYKKISVPDESCEFDSILVPTSPKSGEVLSTIVDLQLQEAKIESDTLKAQLESMNEKLRSMIEENDLLTEVNSILQKDVRKMTEYMEENTRLKEMAVQKYILEQDVAKLRDTLAAMDQLLLSLRESFEKFSTDVHTSMEDLSKKLDQTAERLKKVEDSKTELQKNYASHAQNLTLERQKVDSLLKEKNLLKGKLDTVRIRNAKLDRHMEQLQSELKKLKIEQERASLLPDIESLMQDVARLQEEKLVLSKKNEELTKQSNEAEFAKRLKNVFGKYEQQLEEMKQKMKTAFKEQMLKQTEAQTSAIQKRFDDLRTQSEEQWLRHTEDRNKYKTHVEELNKQILDVGEKFLTEQRQKREILHELNELKVTFQGLQFDASHAQAAFSKCDEYLKSQETDFVSDDMSQENARTMQVIEQENEENEDKFQAIPTTGNIFETEKVENYVFDNIHLADMKEGRFCLPTHDIDRLSVLQQRNSLYLPHLKSSYPAEMQFHPIGFNEEEVKNVTGTPGQAISNTRRKTALAKLRQKQEIQ